MKKKTLAYKRKQNRVKSLRYWKNHPEYRLKQKVVNRKVKLKRFGLTIEMFEEIVKKQNGKCAICNQLPNRSNLDVDHDHKTGKVRGLLCSACNRAIGYMGDNPERLKKAIKYLTNNLMSEETQNPDVEMTPAEETQEQVTVSDLPAGEVVAPTETPAE